MQDANPAPGSPVATFNSKGRYPTGEDLMDTKPYNQTDKTTSAQLTNLKEPHSGIFLGYLKDSSGNVAVDKAGKPVGFEMLAQSADKPANVEQRLFEPDARFKTIPVENYSYSVIATAGK